MTTFKIFLSCSSAFVLGMAQAAHAQDSTQAGSGVTAEATVNEIVVTAQKRSERLVDVPLSVTALAGDDMDKLGVRQTSDLARVVPGFTYQETTFGVPIFTIRGIGLYDLSVGIAPTVSVYVDQVPLPYLAMTSGAALDVERVEVLKGPQGTLFGQNSTGGAINYIAAKPTSTPEMGFDLTYGRFNQIDAQAFVSGPITDTLRMRAAIRHEYRGPWQRSETRPNDELGRRDFANGRVLVDWTPTDRLAVSLTAGAWRDRSETSGSQFVNLSPLRPVAAGGYPDSTLALGGRTPAPDNARTADWNPDMDLRRNDRMYNVSGRIEYELSDAVNLTSITSYAHFRGYIPTDADGTSYSDIQTVVRSGIRSFSQELRLEAEVGAARFIGGGNYQRDITSESRTIFSLSSNQGIGPFRFGGFNNLADQKVSTYAVFGNVDLEIIPKLTAQLGGRYTKQDRDFEGCVADTGNGGLSLAISLISGVVRPNGACVTIDPATFLQPDTVRKSLDQDNVSWKAGLSYKPNRDTNLYANITKGYKAGAFTPLAAVSASQLDPVTQESVLAYEIGLKTSLLDRLASFTGAMFYYKYNDKQISGIGVFPPFGALPQLVNIPKTSVRGAEVELTLRPMAGLRLQGGGTYIKTEVDEDFVTPDPYGTPVNIKGESFPNTPRWQAIGNADYEFAVGNGLNVFLNGNVSYRSAANAAFGENPVFRFKPYALVGARTGIGSSDETWRVEIWGQNIFNKFYWINVSRNVDTTSRTPGMPATYGVTLRTRF